MGHVIVKLHQQQLHDLRNLLLCHGFARSFKLELNKMMRDSPTKNPDSLKQLVVDTLNLLFGADEKSLEFWSKLQARFLSKFFPQFKPDSQNFVVDLISKTRSLILPSLKLRLLSEIKEMMGMKLKDAEVFEPMHLEEVFFEFYQISDSFKVPVKVKQLDLNPFLNIYDFKDLEQFYLRMKENQTGPHLAYTLAFLGDLYAYEMNTRPTSETDFKKLMIQSEQNYVQAFNKLLQLSSVDPALPTDAQATGDSQRPFQQYQMRK